MENKPNKPEKAWWQPAMTVFAEVTGWIVVPIVAALFLGRYLDEKHNSAPWYYLSLTGVAFVISTIGIVIVAGKYIRQIERENQEQRTKNTEQKTKNQDQRTKNNERSNNK
jgi:Na+-transporting methylmalonyl-CoA/oxaloacetate decarboxylase gamma subunit